jgi:hypothetical protein
VAIQPGIIGEYGPFSMPLEADPVAGGNATSPSDFALHQTGEPSHFHANPYFQGLDGMPYPLNGAKETVALTHRNKAA